MSRSCVVSVHLADPPAASSGGGSSKSFHLPLSAPLCFHGDDHDRHMPLISHLNMSRSSAEAAPRGLAFRPGSPAQRKGVASPRGSAGEQAGDPENPVMLSLPVAFVQGEKGKRGGFRVDYSNLLAGINWASDRAARDGVMISFTHCSPALHHCAPCVFIPRHWSKTFH